MTHKQFIKTLKCPVFESRPTIHIHCILFFIKLLTIILYIDKIKLVDISFVCGWVLTEDKNGLFGLFD